MVCDGVRGRKRAGLDVIGTRSGDNRTVSQQSEPGVVVGHFAAFGVDERLIRETLATALSSGGDFADLFFQHRVSSSLALEDGSVNRGSTSVELGVGVRVVKGDQTGYGFTEELTLASLRQAARTAAAIVAGPARPGPTRFHVPSGAATRYPVAQRWEDIAPGRKLPILSDLNARTFGSDARVCKVNVSLSDQTSVVLIADSEGRVTEDVQPMTSLALSCVAEQNGQRETNGYTVAGRADFGFYTPERLERVVREAVARTTVLFEAIPAPAGEFPVGATSNTMTTAAVAISVTKATISKPRGSAAAPQRIANTATAIRTIPAPIGFSPLSRIEQTIFKII